jgi:hypothetical protein
MILRHDRETQTDLATRADPGGQARIVGLSATEIRADRLRIAVLHLTRFFYHRYWHDLPSRASPFL